MIRRVCETCGWFSTDATFGEHGHGICMNPAYRTMGPGDVDILYWDDCCENWEPGVVEDER